MKKLLAAGLWAVSVSTSGYAGTISFDGVQEYILQDIDPEGTMTEVIASISYFNFHAEPGPVEFNVIGNFTDPYLPHVAVNEPCGSGWEACVKQPDGMLSFTGGYWVGVSVFTIPATKFGFEWEPIGLADPLYDYSPVPFILEITGANVSKDFPAAPEPGAWAMMLLGLGSLAVLYRRRPILAANLR